VVPDPVTNPIVKKFIPSEDFSISNPWLFSSLAVDQLRIIPFSKAEAVKDVSSTGKGARSVRFIFVPWRISLS
ncbi:MAG TPA: hypothetical protein VLN45_11875, partial [Ignavibacteriaceae bacterium]|nr:hypothetical protein [Ignavibacteriaceae bacterium]